MNELLNNLIKAHCEMRDALKTSSIKSKSEFMQLFIHYSNSYENLIIQGNKDPQQLLLNIEKEIELRKSDQDILSFLIGLKYSLKSADEKARTKLKVDLFRKFGNNDNADTLMNATELLLSNEMLASEYNEVINTFNQKNNIPNKILDNDNEQIIESELNGIAERFVPKDDLEYAIEETKKFFSNNAYRCKKPISRTQRAKDAVIIAYKKIKINTGRINQFTYKADRDYLEFIKSLFSQYSAKTIEALGATMERKN